MLTDSIHLLARLLLLADADSTSCLLSSGALLCNSPVGVDDKQLVSRFRLTQHSYMTEPIRILT